MFNKIKIVPEMKCSCGRSKVCFTLKVKRVHDARTTTGAQIPLDNRAIFTGCRLQSREGVIHDYIKVDGNCRDCELKHTAILEVKNGIVIGIDEKSVYGISKKEESNLKKITGND